MVFAMQEQLPREYEIKRFDLPNMTHREMDDLLKSQLLCRITFHDEPYPYMLPMEYYYFGDTIYFHFTMTGRKIELMSKNPNVTVEIDWYDDMLTDYKSVILRGRLVPVDNPGRAQYGQRGDGVPRQKQGRHQVLPRNTVGPEGRRLPGGIQHNL